MKWTKQTALDSLRQYILKYGLVPSRQYKAAGQYPSLRVIYRLWGRYRLALVEAGLTVRSHVRWLRYEEDFLKERAGTMTIRTMARRLNRTVPAVKCRLTLLQIGQSGNDGRYTASELARELDCAVGTVIKRVKDGVYRGQKLGGIWRIDSPDEDGGETELG